MARTAECAAPEGSQDRDEWMTVIEMQEYMRASRKELEDDFGGKSSRCEVALEKPTDVAKARAFVTCSYQTSSSRALVYAKEVEEWGFAPFGVGLLTLTAYACCAAGDDDRD